MTIMRFTPEDYRLMARTFRLRAADESRREETDRLLAAARRYEQLARDMLEAEKAAGHSRTFTLSALRF
jgi:hypothetical protein